MYKNELIHINSQSMENERSRIIYEAGLRQGGIPLPDAAAELLKLKRRRRMKLRLRISVAAAAAVAILISLPFVFDAARNGEPAWAGCPGSIYIVDNLGNKIFVDDTDRTVEHAVRSGERCMKYEQVAAETDCPSHTLTVPKGAQYYSLVLSDGTTVRVNSGSRITYPSNFGVQGERTVKVDYGEAFLDVAHDAERPFIVCLPMGATKVLGTRFNVQAFEGVPCNITLLEGSVAVKWSHEKWDGAVVMRPGQNAELTQSGITIADVDVQNYTSWIDGYYRYDRKTVMEILEDICRRYDYRIDGTPTGGDEIHFWFDKDEDMASVVGRLGHVANVEITLEGDRIVVR